MNMNKILVSASLFLFFTANTYANNPCVDAFIAYNKKWEEFSSCNLSYICPAGKKEQIRKMCSHLKQQWIGSCPSSVAKNQDPECKAENTTTQNKPKTRPSKQQHQQ